MRVATGSVESGLDGDVGNEVHVITILFSVFRAGPVSESLLVRRGNGNDARDLYAEGKFRQSLFPCPRRTQWQ